MKLRVVVAVETGTTAPDSVVDLAVAVALPITVVMEIAHRLRLHRETMAARAAVMCQLTTSTRAVAVAAHRRQVAAARAPAAAMEEQGFSPQSLGLMIISVAAAVAVRILLAVLPAQGGWAVAVTARYMPSV